MAIWSSHMIWLLIMAVVSKTIYCEIRWITLKRYISYNFGHRNVTCGIDPGKAYLVTIALRSDKIIDKYECVVLLNIENQRNSPKETAFLATWAFHINLCKPLAKSTWTKKDKFGARRRCYYLPITPKRIVYKMHIEQDAFPSHSGKELQAVVYDMLNTKVISRNIQLPIIIKPLSFSYQIMDIGEEFDNRINVDKEIIHLASSSSLKNKKLGFCIKNLPQGGNRLKLIKGESNRLSIDSTTESLSKNYDFYQVCSSVDIDLTQQTVYLLTASETYATCTRSADWRVIFSTCEADKIKEVGNGNPYIAFLGEKNNQPCDDCFLIDGKERWRATFTLVLTDGCSSEILIQAIHPSDRNDKKLISQIDIKDCKHGRGSEECKYKKPRKAEFGNIAEYEITITRKVEQRLSSHDIYITIPRPANAPGTENRIKKLGTVRVTAPGFIATTYEITGFEYSREELHKKFTTVHFNAEKHRNLTFCVRNIITPFEITLDKQTVNRVCVQKAIDTATRTVHEFSYKETDNCRRNEYFTLVLNSCRAVRFQNILSLRYDRILSPDRCLRVEGKDSWSVTFSVEIPDDCFGRKIIVSALNPAWRKGDLNAVELKVFNMSQCEDGANAECIYQDGGLARENMKTYRIGFSYPAYLKHSGHKLIFSIHGKDKSVPHYNDTLGYLNVTARKARLLFMITSIHDDFVDLVEDEEIKVFAWIKNQGKVLLVFCVNNLIGNVTLTIDKHEAQPTKADKCVYLNLQLRLGRMTLRYRENNSPCSDRHGVTYLRIVERPSHLTTNKPDNPKEISEEDTNNPVARAPKQFTTEEILRFVFLVVMGAIIILALIFYITYWRKKDRQQGVLEESAPTEMTESETFSIKSSSEVENPNMSKVSESKTSSIYDIASSFLSYTGYGGQSTAISTQKFGGESSKLTSLSTFFLGTQPTSKYRDTDSSVNDQSF